MPKNWVNPKFVSRREKMDRRLERSGLLNYQTEGLAPEEIARRYAAAGISINGKSQWFKDNYGFDAPEVLTDRRQMFAYQQQARQGQAPNIFPQVQIQQPRIIPAGGKADRPQNFIQMSDPVTGKPTLTPVKMPTSTPLMNPNAQTDWKAQDFDWMQLSEQQKKDIIGNPDFRMNDVQAMGQQGFILSDSQFGLYNQTKQPNGKRGPAYGGRYNPGINPNGTGYGPNGDLQWWQPAAYTALSNPYTAPLVQGGSLAIMSGGNPAGLLAAGGITAAGYAAMWKGNENPLLNWIGEQAEKGMYALNYGAQTLEQAAGTMEYLRGDEQASKSSWMPIVDIYRTVKDIVKAKRLGEFISDPELRKAVWDSSVVYYDTKGIEKNPIIGNYIDKLYANDPQKAADTKRVLNAILPITRDEGEVWVLGEAEAVPVKPGYTMEDARKKMLSGEYTTDMLIQEYQQAYGFSGVASDFLLQSVFDPLNVADSAVSTTKGILADARATRLDAVGTPEAIARAQVERIKARVYYETPSANPFTDNVPWSETARRIRAGLQEAANTSGNIASALTPWERKVAGITPDGKIAELTPSAPSNIPAFIQNLFTLNPDAKLRLFLDRGASVMQGMFDYARGESMSATDMVGTLRSVANADMTALKNAGAEYLSSPEAYTIISQAKDFLPKMEAQARTFDALAAERQRVIDTLTALGGDRTVMQKGFTQADWQRLLKTDNPLKADIDAGRITYDSLRKDFDLFKYRKDGTTKNALTMEEFNAKTAAAFEDHALNWGKEYFGVKEASTFEDGLRALKGLQSLLLLDISPTSIMNDIINERVMIATTGTLGLTDSAVITRFMDDMGVKNADAQSTGGMGDAARANPDPVSRLTKGSSIFSKAADAIQSVRSKLPRSKITSKTNEAHQSQVRYHEMKKFMSRYWTEGQGYKRMSPSLENRLREYGYDPATVYQNLRGTFRPEQIDALMKRATNVDVQVYVQDAATVLGKDPAATRAMLDELGVLDKLKAALEKAQTPEQRLLAFDRVSDTAMNSIDVRMARQLKTILEQTRNKIKMEGPAGTIQVFQEMALDYLNRKMDNDRIWDEAYQVTDGMEPDQRNAIMSKAARENRAAWTRTQARQAALYVAAIEGLGMTSDFGRTFLANLGEEQRILRKYFEDHGAKADKLSRQGGAWYESFAEEFNTRWAKDYGKVMDLQRKRGKLFVSEMVRTFGEQAEPMAQQWIDGVINATGTIDLMTREHRDSLKGLPFDERKRAWETFKPEALKAWAERTKLDMAGAANLYKWDENAPYVSDYLDKANADIEVMKQADNERRAGVWAVAEQFGFTQDLKSKGHLEFGVMRKPEYGGIPDLKGLQDPRMTPELVREVLTKRAQVQAEQARMQPELSQQPAPTATPTPAATVRSYKIGDNTKLGTAIKEMGGINVNLARDLIGDIDTRRTGGLFKVNGRTDLDIIAIELKEYGYPIDLNNPDDIGGMNQLRDMIQRQVAGDDVYPMGKSYNKAIEKAARAYANEALEIEQTKWKDEADTLTRALDEFNRMDPEAEAKALDLVNRAAQWYDTTESIWETAHNDRSLLDTFTEINERAGALYDEVAQFESMVNDATRAAVDMETMQTHADGSSKRQAIHQQSLEIFGEEQGAYLNTITDLQADQWARMTGRTREEYYATRYDEIRREGGGEIFQQAPATDTPEFKNWFGNSKVVDENGEPLVVYHGTKADFQVFDKNRIGENFGADERGFFFISDPKQASDYATSNSVGLTAEEGGNVMPVYVSLKKPLVIDDGFLRRQGMDPIGVREDVISFWDNYQSLIYEWMDAKKSDGVILVDNTYRPNGEPTKMVVAKKATQIKSTANRGTFDPTNPNIMYQQAGVNAKGGVDFASDGRATIYAMKAADVSTGIHEHAHVFLESMYRTVDEALPRYKRSLEADVKTLKDWTSLKQEGDTWTAANASEYKITMRDGQYLYQDPSMKSPLTFPTFGIAQYRLEHEMFARGFEKYMADGKAPSIALRNLFMRFAEWLKEIYNSAIKQKAITNVEISEPMRGLYNRLLTFDHDAPYGWKGLPDAESRRATTDVLVGDDIMARAQAERERLTQPRELSYGIEQTGYPDGSYHIRGNDGILYNLDGKKITRPQEGKLPKRYKSFEEAQAALQKAGYTDADTLLQAAPPAKVWQYTLQQYADIAGKDFKPWEIEQTHRVAVEQAYHRGDPIPEAVLDEYPHLMNPEAERYNTPDAIAMRDARREELARQYYSDRNAREDRFWQQDSDPAPVWYLKLERTIDAIPQETMTVQQMRGALTKAGVKADEMYWTGFDEWLDSKKPGEKVTRAEAMQAITPLDIQEVTRGAGTEDPQSRQIYDEAQQDRDYAESALDRAKDDTIQELKRNGVDEDTAYEYVDAMYSEEDTPLKNEAWEVVSQIKTNFDWNKVYDRLYDYDRAARDFDAQTVYPTPTKYEDYTLPGGENYREVLFKLPLEQTPKPDLTFEEYFAEQPWGERAGRRLSEATPEQMQEYRRLYEEWVPRNAATYTINKQYQSGHWDEPNVLAHTRLNDRIDADGKRVLFVEEIQSDWHQAGREKGYGEKTVRTYRAYYDTPEHGQVPIAWGNTEAEARAQAGIWNDTVDVKIDYEDTVIDKGIPQAPFAKTWQDMVMKRILRMAAEGGYDRVAWTTGAQQAARYNLANQVDSVITARIPGEADLYDVRIMAKNEPNTILAAENWTAQELADNVGKDLANKIIAAPDGMHTWKADDLAVGGEGMKGFYDNMLPAFVDKYTKKWGARTGKTDIVTKEGNVVKQTKYGLDWKEYAEVNSVDVTPEMRRSVMLGQPLFQQQPTTPAPIPTLPPGGYDQHAGFMDVGKILYDGWSDEVKPVLDEMKRASQKKENRYNFEGMDGQTRKELNLYLAEKRGELATAKNAARRWGDEMVDFTILDYRRQYGFDKLLGAAVPYEFYGTRSMLNWATRLVDRPQYLAHFARLQHLRETYDSQLPERMRGKYWLPTPFMPEWGGDGVFIDPKFALFPWTQFMQPLEAMKRENSNIANSATYQLRNWAEEGTITEAEAAEALNTRSGPLWEKAIEQSRVEQGDNLNSSADYFSMLFGPALYLTVPYYLATGKKFAGINSSYPSGQLPITRTAQAMETAFKDTPMEWLGNTAGLLAKPENMAREALDLPKYGEWGDYYIDRQLANMAAEGMYTAEQVQIAMLERKGPIYDEAEERVRYEMMLRIPGMAPLYNVAHGATFDQVIGSLLPSLFPGGLLPPAEMEYKGLKQEYGLAWDQWEQGNKEALNQFFENHPEYQARLALRRDPSERLEQFLKSQIYEAYGELGETDQKTAKAEIKGLDEYFDAMRENPGQSFSIEQLTRWAQMLGAAVPSTPETQPTIDSTQPIEYMAPEITAITDIYYEQRKSLHPNYWELEGKYYDLPKSERRTFLIANPELKAYWDWKRSWYDRYPELQPVFKGEVFKEVDTSTWNPMLVEYVADYAYSGTPLPTGAYKALRQVWINEGQPRGSVEEWLKIDLAPAFLYGN